MEMMQGKTFMVGDILSHHHRVYMYLNTLLHKKKIKFPSID